MTINLSDLRVRIDQATEKIVSGLKDRSRYTQNMGIFTEEFSEGMTWFLHRLKREQDIDSEFGRFEYPDQYPLAFKRDQLDQPKKERPVLPTEVKNINIDISHDLITFYMGIIPELCKQGEDKNSYGETAKCDVDNLILYNERNNGIGRHVAESKIQQDPSILEEKTDEELRGMLVKPEREEKVIIQALAIAKSYDLQDPELIKKFFKKIMDLSVDVQVQYIKGVKNSTN